MYYIYIHTCYIKQHTCTYILNRASAVYYITINILCSQKQWNLRDLYIKPSVDLILITFYRKDRRTAGSRMENMRFPRQSHVVTNKYSTHWGPRCVLLLIKQHLRQDLCCIFNKMERGATVCIIHLAFLHTAKTSARDDKLLFSERSSEILTRVSSKNHWISFYVMYS